MNFHRIKYFLVYLTPLVVSVSIAAHGIWTYLSVFVLFGLLPFLELFTKGSTKNLSAAEEEMAKKINYMIYCFMDWYRLNTPFLYTFCTGLVQTTSPATEPVGITVSFGLLKELITKDARVKDLIYNHRNCKYSFNSTTGYIIKSE